MATKIIVRDESSSTATLENGRFVCTHDGVVINPPCCSGMDCDCDGIYRLVCSCGKEINQDDVDKILAKKTR